MIHIRLISSQGRKKNVVVVALGTATGDVLAVDVLASKKIWTNSSCHSGYVELSIANHLLH